MPGMEGLWSDRKNQIESRAETVSGEYMRSSIRRIKQSLLMAAYVIMRTIFAKDFL